VSAATDKENEMRGSSGRKATRWILALDAAIVVCAVAAATALSTAVSVRHEERTVAKPSVGAIPASATTKAKSVRASRHDERLIRHTATPAKAVAAGKAGVARKHVARFAGPAVASFSLCVKAGTATLPGGVVVPIWGYALKPALVACTDASVVPTMPGPQLVVPTPGGVSITVTNALSVPTSLEVPQYGVEQGPVEVAPLASLTYTVNATRPGTFLYQSEANGGRQIAMGLFGALVVRPVAGAGRAYEDATTAFAAESVLVLSEIDPALNNAVDPMAFNMESWKPSYWLINGKAYPDTRLTDTLGNPVSPAAGSKLLLRYVNAGLDNNTMTMLGMHARLVGRDGYALANPFDVVSETIASGQTVDEIASIPAAASGSHLPLYNRQLHLSNGALGAPAHDDGGMLTFVDVP
jgi:FtsP/CotA-like multicopper oxidase with cupredoxin domain